MNSLLVLDLDWVPKLVRFLEDRMVIPFPVEDLCGYLGIRLLPFLGTTPDVTKWQGSVGDPLPYGLMAYTSWTHSGEAVIHYNARLSLRWRRHAIAHEVFHALIGPVTRERGTEPRTAGGPGVLEEEYADHFAMELLAPLPLTDAVLTGGLHHIADLQNLDITLTFLIARLETWHHSISSNPFFLRLYYQGNPRVTKWYLPASRRSELEEPLLHLTLTLLLNHARSRELPLLIRTDPQPNDKSVRPVFFPVTRMLSRLRPGRAVGIRTFDRLALNVTSAFNSGQREALGLPHDHLLLPSLFSSDKLEIGFIRWHEDQPYRRKKSVFNLVFAHDLGEGSNRERCNEDSIFSNVWLDVKWSKRDSPFSISVDQWLRRLLSVFVDFLLEPSTQPGGRNIVGFGGSHSYGFEAYFSVPSAFTTVPRIQPYRAATLVPQPKDYESR